MARLPNPNVLCFRVPEDQRRTLDAYVLQNGTTRQAVLEDQFNRWMVEAGLAPPCDHELLRTIDGRLWVKAGRAWCVLCHTKVVPTPADTAQEADHA